MEKLSTTTLAALKEKKRRRHLPLVFFPVFLGFAAIVWRHLATLARPRIIGLKRSTKGLGLKLELASKNCRYPAKLDPEQTTSTSLW